MNYLFADIFVCSALFFPPLLCTVFTARRELISIRKGILPTLRHNLFIHSFKCQGGADYVRETIQR